METEEESFEYATPHKLFDIGRDLTPNRNRYDVASDGQRFVVVTLLADTVETSDITVVLDWTAELE